MDIQKMYENICRLQKEFESKYEVWKPISISKGKYVVSSFGRVRNSKTRRIMRSWINSKGYYSVCFRNTKSSKVSNHSVHRLVAIAFIENPFSKRCVDHIDNNPSNNHVSNLRWATYSENSMNRSMMTNNTSGIIGVSWDKNSKKWQAHVKVHGKLKKLGIFESKEQAAEVRLKYANQLFGEFTHISQKINLV